MVSSMMIGVSHILTALMGVWWCVGVTEIQIGLD
jgi:hypothetical protein